MTLLFAAWIGACGDEPIARAKATPTFTAEEFFTEMHHRYCDCSPAEQASSDQCHEEGLESFFLKLDAFCPGFDGDAAYECQQLLVCRDDEDSGGGVAGVCFEAGSVACPNPTAEDLSLGFCCVEVNTYVTSWFSYDYLCPEVCE